MGSGEETGPFLTHYFFRPLYLSIAIIRPFDRALLIISGDIEENPGPVSFDRYKKTPTTLSPSPSTSSSSYHSMDESTFYSARSSRSGMSSNESSPEIKFKLPSNDCTRHSPYQLPPTRQLQLVLTHAKISSPLSHIVDQLGPSQKTYNIAASASCRIKINIKSPTSLILPTVRINLTLQSVVA